MIRGALAVMVMSIWIISVNCQTTSSRNTLRCRLCHRAYALSDCNQFIECDSTLEECYMDELYTDQRRIVYEGGCRAKDVCFQSGGRKRSDKVTCSSCCAFEDDCNRRLCGIKDDTVGTSQCYSCSQQRQDRPCLTLTSCQPNEMCYLTRKDVGGVDLFTSGCINKLVCPTLMSIAYNDYRRCVINATALEPWQKWEHVCGSFGNHQAGVCTACCADGACNFGTCQEMRKRIFTLASIGKFDMKTLKEIP